MAKVQLATRLEDEVKYAMEQYCSANGVKIGHFISEAIVDRLEELQDARDVIALRREPTESWESLVRDLDLRPAEVG